MASRQRMKNPPAIQYLINKGHNGSGDFIIELPANWRLTFSGVNPANVHDTGWCVRVYEGEKLRAVYPAVLGFRDLSIPMARKLAPGEWQKDGPAEFNEELRIA
jgi:hypothetical protein